MSKIITFKVPVQARKGRAVTHEERQGTICLLPVGGTTVRFVLQRDRSGRASDLVHFASGFRVGSLNDARVRDMCTRGTCSRLSDRGAALAVLARAVARMGAHAVLATMDAAPVINP